METLWSKNYKNPSDRKSHTWAPLKRLHILKQDWQKSPAGTRQKDGKTWSGLKKWKEN